jgi:hypothetical protein
MTYDYQRHLTHCFRLAGSSIGEDRAVCTIGRNIVYHEFRMLDTLQGPLQFIYEGCLHNFVKKKKIYLLI